MGLVPSCEPVPEGLDGAGLACPGLELGSFRALSSRLWVPAREASWAMRPKRSRLWIDPRVIEPLVSPGLFRCFQLLPQVSWFFLLRPPSRKLSVVGFSSPPFCSIYGQILCPVLSKLAPGVDLVWRLCPRARFRGFPCG